MQNLFGWILRQINLIEAGVSTGQSHDIISLYLGPTRAGFSNHSLRLPARRVAIGVRHSCSLRPSLWLGLTGFSSWF